MKIKSLVTVLLVAFILASCAPAAKVVPTEMTAPMADNFAFILRDNPCEVNILDTASGTLVHFPVGERTSITIPLRLIHDELESVYQKALSINFFDYPAKIVAPDNLVHMTYAPSGTYDLSMTNGAMTNSTTWTSDIITEPLFAQAAQFMELVKFIRKIIESHPEFKQLPEPKAACA